MKFWEIPELVEKLVALLDPLSTTRLAQSGVMKTDIFQKSMSSKVWKNFIRQSSSVSVDREVLLREDVKRLVAVLNLMKVEDPTNFLVALLDLVSAQFPSCQGESFPFERNGRVEVTSPHRTEPLTTSLWGFLLLEDVEGALGRAEQSIRSISVDKLCEPYLPLTLPLCQPYLAAVASRISRQQEAVTSVSIERSLQIRNRLSAQALHILMQVHLTKRIFLMVESGIEGWGLLARTAQLHPQMIGAVCTSLPALAKGTRGDVKKILNAVEEGFVVFKTDQHLQEVDTVRGLPASVNVSNWEKMKEIMYMTEDEFNDELQEEKSRLERIDWGEGGWTMVFEEVEETDDDSD